MQDSQKNLLHRVNVGLLCEAVLVRRDFFRCPSCQAPIGSPKEAGHTETCKYYEVEVAAEKLLKLSYGIPAKSAYGWRYTIWPQELENNDTRTS